MAATKGGKKAAVTAVRRRRERKNIERGAAHIQSTFNNTIVTITDTQGNAVSWASAGELGFRGSRKSTPFAAQTAAETAAKIAMETLLNREKLTLPDEGAPEGASEALVAAIEDYRARAQAEQTATEQMNAAERYMPDDAVWTYISSKRGYQDAMSEAERKMQALGELSGSVQAITAPRDGYIAEVLVKEGDTYDGSGALFSVNKEGSSPVLRADLTGVEKNVAEGMTVTVSSDRYGSLETRVLSVGMDAEGKKYADVELTDDIIQSMGSVYSMTVEDTPLVLVNRAKQQTTLLSASAVHGSGTDRYIYTVDTTYSNFGNSKMTVHKMSVTVLAEAGGVASIQEDVGYYSIAYMEDRPINDGDAVMLYDD